MDLRIKPLNVADERGIESSYRIVADANTRDVPDFAPLSRSEYLGRTRHPWPSGKRFTWLAAADGQPVGVLEMSIPQLDNRHLAEVGIWVHPDQRRRGVGRALHAHAVEVARQHGRTTIGGDYVTALPGGDERDPAHAAFAAAVGAKAALPEVRSRLDLDTVDREALGAMLDDARTHAGGYSAVEWADAVPDEYVHDIAMLDGRFVLDAPQGDLNIEPQKMDAERVRGGEETLRLRGRRMYNVGLRHDASGRLAAWTTIGFDADRTTHAWQQITIVDPAHRGHRLGLVVKIENLLRTLAAEPALRHINTWNAAENSHMIAINTAIGFRPVDGWVSCQQDI